MAETSTTGRRDDRRYQVYAETCSMILYLYLRHYGSSNSHKDPITQFQEESFAEDISGFWQAGMEAILNGIRNIDTDSFFEDKPYRLTLTAKLRAPKTITLVFQTSQAGTFLSWLQVFLKGGKLEGSIDSDPTMPFTNKGERLKILLKHTQFTISDDTLTIDLPSADFFKSAATN